MAEKYPREYERVPGIEVVDRSSVVAVAKARDQWVRDRAIDLEEVKILRDRMQECYRREEVNSGRRCREHVKDYMEAFRNYKLHGWRH